MIVLTIKQQDGTVKSVVRFPTQTEADQWLTDVKAQTNWNQTNTVDSIDTSAADAAAKAAADAETARLATAINNRRDLLRPLAQKVKDGTFLATDILPAVKLLVILEFLD